MASRWTAVRTHRTIGTSGTRWRVSGAGSFIVGTTVVATHTFGTTPYTLADQVQVVSSAVWANLAELLSAISTTTTGVYLPSNPLFDTAAATDAAVVVRAVDGDPTTGDGTLTVRVYGTIETVPA